MRITIDPSGRVRYAHLQSAPMSMLHGAYQKPVGASKRSGANTPVPSSYI